MESGRRKEIGIVGKGEKERGPGCWWKGSWNRCCETAIARYAQLHQRMGGDETGSIIRWKRSLSYHPPSSNGEEHCFTTNGLAPVNHPIQCVLVRSTIYEGPVARGWVPRGIKDQDEVKSGEPRSWKTKREQERFRRRAARRAASRHRSVGSSLLLSLSLPLSLSLSTINITS